MAVNFIVWADDYLAATEKIEEIKKGFDITSEAIMYNLNDEGLYSLVDELTTVSLFDETKFVVARGSENLLSGKSDKAFTELLKAMNDQHSSNILVLLFMENLDFNNERYIKLKRFSSYIEVKTKNIKLDEFAKKTFINDGFSVEDSVIQLLVSYADSLSKLKGYIDQLECYKFAEKKITSNDVFTLIPSPLDDNVYALIDAVLANNKKLMLKGYQDMKLKSMQASNLVSMLINKFQELYNVNVLIKSGFNQGALAEALNISSGRAYYMIKNAKAYTMGAIKKHLDLLNELDYKIKTGQIDQNLGLELYFLN